MEASRDLVDKAAREVVEALIDPIETLRASVSAKYGLDEQCGRSATTKALIQTAVAELINESCLAFDDRCDLEDRVYRMIVAVLE